MTITNVRYDVMGSGHDAYRDVLEILGPCVPQIVGWCELDVDGFRRSALVVTQTWPFLPLGTDPRPIIKAKKYGALIPNGLGFRVVEVPAPPSMAASVESARLKTALAATEIVRNAASPSAAARELADIDRGDTAKELAAWARHGQKVIGALTAATESARLVVGPHGHQPRLKNVEYLGRTYQCLVACSCGHQLTSTDPDTELANHIAMALAADSTCSPDDREASP